MKIIRPHSSICKLYNYARPQELLDKHRTKYKPKVDAWNKLKKQNVDEKIIAEIIGISRAKYYRYRKILENLEKNIFPPSKRPKNLRKSKISKSTKQRILEIRRKDGYGKDKISAILKRDYNITLSGTAVNEVLNDFKKRGLITCSKLCPKKKRKRNFKSHAKRWNYNMKAKRPGEMVQIDHMTANKNGVTVKHFQAWDPITKVIVAASYSNATSNTARRFLKKVIDDLPFTLSSIQVDGGSEFMKHFEESCKDKNIPLYVLPPKRPQYNGGVERGNRIFREEFYSNEMLADSVGGINAELQIAVKKYNNYRPHHSLKLSTPMEYYNKMLEAA